jgi:endonuclease YncB( thermonuclease family)
MKRMNFSTLFRGGTSMINFASILFIVLFVLAPFNCAAESTTVVAAIDAQHTLTVVIDGFNRKQVRLYGIDIPDEGQPFGVAATRRLKRLTRQPFRLETLRQDEQGRAVALLTTLEGRSINAMMVAQGYAWVRGNLCRKAFCSDWMASQINAKRQKIGLWSQPAPQPPWQWRKANGQSEL